MRRGFKEPFLQGGSERCCGRKHPFPGGRVLLYLPYVLGHVLRVHEDGKEAVDVPLELLVAF